MSKNMEFCNCVMLETCSLSARMGTFRPEKMSLELNRYNPGGQGLLEVLTVSRLGLWLSSRFASLPAYVIRLQLNETECDKEDSE
jgi:hypothetical protein